MLHGRSYGEGYNVLSSSTYTSQGVFQHVNHSSVPPLHGTITLRMIRGGSGRLNTTQLMEFREHLVVKLLPLVVMQFLRESKPHNKFIEDLFTSCSTFVVKSWINLHKPCGPVEPTFRIINGPVQLRDKNNQ